MSENQSLITLVKNSQQIVEALIESGGELTPEMEMSLKNLEVNIPDKIDSYAFILEKLDSEITFWKAKAESLRAVAKGCENMKDRLKESLKYAAQELGTNELVGNDTKFKISNSKPRLVLDGPIDSAYVIQVTTSEVDKKRIEEDLRLGVPVTGARLEETKSIRPYANKKVE